MAHTKAILLGMRFFCFSLLCINEFKKKTLKITLASPCYLETLIWMAIDNSPKKRGPLTSFYIVGYVYRKTSHHVCTDVGNQLDVDPQKKRACFLMR
jgi:hypothetical protein